VILVGISLFRNFPSDEPGQYTLRLTGRSKLGQAGTRDDEILKMGPVCGPRFILFKAIRAGTSTISLDSVGLNFAIVAGDWKRYHSPRKTIVCRCTGKQQRPISRPVTSGKRQPVLFLGDGDAKV
jgi:hypothetical protein